MRFRRIAVQSLSNTSGKRTTKWITEQITKMSMRLIGTSIPVRSTQASNTQVNTERSTPPSTSLTWLTNTTTSGLSEFIFSGATKQTSLTTR